MLLYQLRRRASRKRQLTGEHLLVDDRQTVLVALQTWATVEQFRGGVDGGQAAHERHRCVLYVLDQPEIRHLCPAAHNQQVLRLDVQVLQRVVFAHIVERVCRVAEIQQQFFARDTGQARFDTLPVTILEAEIGQLGDDHQLAVNNLEPLQ